MDLGQELAADTPCRTACRATAQVSLLEKNNFEAGVPYQMVGDTAADNPSPDDTDVGPLRHG